MEGSKLDNVIYNINNNRSFLLSIFDTDKASNIVKYMPGTSILEEYETGEAYFEHLFQNGHRNMVISLHNKNGSGKKKIAEPVTVSLSPNTESEQPVSQPVFNNPPMPMIPTTNETFGGLGVPQLMDLYVEKNEASRLRTENAELKAKNTTLEVENKKYYEQILSEKYNYDKEKDKKESTNGVIQGLIGALPMMVQQFSPNANGLNAPAEFGSQIKNDFAQTIKSQDDITISVLSRITENLGQNNEFSNELVELLKKHKLW